MKLGDDVSWILLTAITVALALALFGVLARGHARRRQAATVDARVDARDRGSDRAALQHPFIDLTRCIGCGLCVAACPEEQVLDLLHGQAVVVHGSRCVGHGRCAEACPVGAIALTLGDVAGRDDLPAVTESWEAIGAPGVFLAGEVTGYALVRTAISHGVEVANVIAKRVPRSSSKEVVNPDSVHDVIIVGAGPAGLACALRARELGLDALTIDRESIGGTVARYPRRKLVMTQPVTLPLHGKLRQTSFVKEELIDLWERVAREAELAVRTGVTYHGLTRADDHYEVETSEGVLRGRHVVLALGRRGTPRKLGVPGEELPKVAYSLLDAQSYRGRRVLVVGGGDSAVEAAVGLSEQPDNTVTLSYRKHAFARIKAANERRLQAAIDQGRLTVVLGSNVTRIGEAEVEIGREAADRTETIRIPNDDVFVFVGGVPPFRLLQDSGVSFDPTDRLPVDPVRERGPGLVVALTSALALAVLVATWAIAHRDYYGVDPTLRLDQPTHDLLRAVGPIGLTAGIIALATMIWNLSYLVRRARWGQWLPGTLSFWMSSHVLTGIVALLAVLVHSGFTLRSSVGGYAALCMTIVVAAGAIGRYLYSFVPRAANGRELALDETRAEFDRLSLEWESRGSDFGQRARRAVESLVEHDRWHRSFLGRVFALLTSEARVRRELGRLRVAGNAEGFTPQELDRWLQLALRAHRAALAVAHYEDLRGVLATWRYVHRWLALLLVLFVGTHVASAWRYADFGPPPAVPTTEDSVPTDTAERVPDESPRENPR